MNNPTGCFYVYFSIAHPWGRRYSARIKTSNIYNIWAPGVFDNLWSTNISIVTNALLSSSYWGWLSESIPHSGMIHWIIDYLFCTKDNQGSSGGRQSQGETATIHLSLLNVQVLPEYLVNRTRTKKCRKSCTCKTDPFLLNDDFVAFASIKFQAFQIVDRRLVTGITSSAVANK